MGRADVHCHLLWGMDDGARDAKEALAMLRRAAADGITRIVATPHATPGIYPFDRARFERTLDEARALCAREGLDIELFPGAEILYTEQTCRLLEEGQIPALAGTRCALVEFSPDVRWEALRDALAGLRRSGFTPMLAHAERYGCLARLPGRTDALRAEFDARFQINCLSLLRPRGMLARRLIERMLARNLLDCVATDAHRAEGARGVHMRAACAALESKVGEERAVRCSSGDWLLGPERNRVKS